MTMLPPPSSRLFGFRLWSSFIVLVVATSLLPLAPSSKESADHPGTAALYSVYTSRGIAVFADRIPLIEIHMGLCFLTALGVRWRILRIQQRHQADRTPPPPNAS